MLEEGRKLFYDIAWYNKIFVKNSRLLHICSMKIFNFREVSLFTITTELYVMLVLWLVYAVVKIRVDHWLKPFYYHLLLVWRLIIYALFRGRSFSVMAFENIFLKIDREPQHYQRVFAIKIIKKIWLVQKKWSKSWNKIFHGSCSPRLRI